MKWTYLIFMLSITSCQNPPTAAERLQQLKDTDSAHKADSIENNTRLVSKQRNKDSLEKDQLRRAEALKKFFIIKNDEFRNIKFYRHKNWPESWPDKKELYAYFNSKGELFLVSNYYADDWIFHTRIILVVNGENYESSDVPTFSEANKTQNSGGGVWENVTYTYDKNIIEAIANNYNKVVKVRLVGRQYYSDFILSDRSKRGFKDTWDLYNALSFQ